MKKILALVFAAAMVIAVGCSQQETAAPAGDVTMQYMTADELEAVLGSEDYLILDVRKAADYEAGHITGSVSADMDAAKNGDAEAGKATMSAATEGFDKNIVLVCYSGKAYAQASTNALSAIGYDVSKVYTLQDGFNNWSEVKAGLVEPQAAATGEEAPVADGGCA